MSNNSRRFIVGIFDDEHEMIVAARDLKKHRISIFDFYTPFPVHGLDDLLEIKRTRLPIVCFIAGSIGLIFALYFQYWVSVVSWPVNIGGKSHNSFPAFIPVAFEIVVLLGALVTVAAFFLRSKLFPGAKVELLNGAQTDNKFIIAIEEKDATLDIGLIDQILSKNHATEVVRCGGDS